MDEKTLARAGPSDINDINVEMSKNLYDSDENDSDYEDDDEDDENIAEYKDKYRKTAVPQAPKQVKKRAVRRPFSKSKLSVTLKGLMGEANLRYAKGEIELAEKMCFEVIRQAPDAYEPYFTLTQIYENRDWKKYGIYLTIATHLNTQDICSWCSLADYHLREGKLKDSISCYSQAINAQPHNMELHLKRLQLSEQLGDPKLQLKYKRKMASKMPRRQYQKIIEISKEVTQAYHAEKMYEQAIQTLNIPFNRIPKKVTQDLVNMMLELYLITEKYTQCLDIFTEFCNFEFDVQVNEDGSISINDFTMPEKIQIDLKVKFIVCLVKLRSINLVPPLIDSIVCNEKVEKIGDLYLDVAEALMSEHVYEQALKLLVPLVKSKDYSLAAVWLKYAECLTGCNMNEQAVEAYFTVMALAPQHVEVLYPLAMLLLKLDKKSEALEVLSQDATHKLDVAVLLERMKLLKQIGDLDQYFKCAELLMSRHCIIFHHKSEIDEAFTTQRPNEKIAKIRKMREYRGDNSEVTLSIECIREPSVEEEYEIFLDIVKLAYFTERYCDMQKICFMGLTSKKFNDKFQEICLMAFYASYNNRDGISAYKIVRDLLLHNSKNNFVWNIFNLVVQSTEEMRHVRFLNTEKLKTKGSEIIEANNDVSVGDITSGLKFYMKKFKEYKSPFLSFMLGCTLLQVYSQRNEHDKKMLAEIVTHLFLNYMNTRSEDARNEAFYNVGRMYQHLGIMYLAEHYYLKALEETEFSSEYPDVLSLKYEAAYNLHLIYKRSGNFVKARETLLKHIVI